MKKLTLLVALVLCIVTVTGCNDKKETVNYEDYKGDWKLKVAEDEELYLFTSLEDYYGITGVSIEEISNNFVKGSIYSIQGAPSYRQANVTFEGEIQDGKLMASYEDEGWLYAGNIEMILENEKIVANITRDEVENTPLWGIPEGEFTFVRPIETEIVNLSEEEKSKLEEFLFILSKDKIKPFNKGELTDEMIINFVGVNVGLGYIDISEFGDRVKEKDANVMFDESVMNELAIRYYGVPVNEHKSYEITSYKNGIYLVPLMGGVSEYPLIQIMMKETKNNNIYYAIVDYIFEYPEEGKQLEYQYLIELQKDDNYIIKSIKEIRFPIDFKMLNQFLNENE